jgi:hypothetical protein
MVLSPKQQRPENSRLQAAGGDQLDCTATRSQIGLAEFEGRRKSMDAVTRDGRLLLAAGGECVGHIPTGPDHIDAFSQRDPVRIPIERMQR